MMTAREGGGTCASLVLLTVASLAAAGVLRAPSGIGGGGISGGTGGARVGGVGAGGYVLRRFPEASGALCLDGTLGGVYVRQARGAADAKGERGLIIHLQGGGWCTSADESRCAARASSAARRHGQRAERTSRACLTRATLVSSRETSPSLAGGVDGPTRGSCTAMVRARPARRRSGARARAVGRARTC